MTPDDILKCVFLTPEERAEFEKSEPPTATELHETTNRLLNDLVQQLEANRDSLQHSLDRLTKAIINKRGK